ACAVEGQGGDANLVPVHANFDVSRLGVADGERAITRSGCQQRTVRAVSHGSDKLGIDSTPSSGRPSAGKIPVYDAMVVRPCGQTLEAWVGCHTLNTVAMTRQSLGNVAPCYLVERDRAGIAPYSKKSAIGRPSCVQHEPPTGKCG